MRGFLKVLAALAASVFFSTAAYAQASIAGAVRDTSGAVLPGVTVEAASPALIEKVRSVVTDGEGRYNIVDLRPGTYTVTFSLPGFTGFRREGIVLTAGFTATVNADMQVGAVEETITVTGETPLVDTQNVRRQTAVSDQMLDTLRPARKTPTASSRSRWDCPELPTSPASTPPRSGPALTTEKGARGRSSMA